MNMEPPGFPHQSFDPVTVGGFPEEFLGYHKGDLGSCRGLMRSGAGQAGSGIPDVDGFDRVFAYGPATRNKQVEIRFES